MSTLCGSLEALTWENQFFGVSSAILHVNDDAPFLSEKELQLWQRIQAKIPADRTKWLDALQERGFHLVESEVDFSITIYQSSVGAAEIATESDISELRLLAAEVFLHTRFRAPWYAEEDSRRFYAQWIENAVKGTFDHQCLIFRGEGGKIIGFVSLRQVSTIEARIGLLSGQGIGSTLMQAAIYWAKERQVPVLRVSTQMGNISALRCYISNGAKIETTAYWLYR